MDQNTATLLRQIVPFIILIAVMYFMLIRPQKKKEKEIAAMRSALKVGDSIVTIGGICGKVVRIKDDTLVIQVSGDKAKMEIMKWAVSQVVASKKAESASRKPKKLKKESSNSNIVDVETEDIVKEVPADAEIPAPAETEVQEVVAENVEKTATESTEENK